MQDSFIIFANVFINGWPIPEYRIEFKTKYPPRRVNVECCFSSSFQIENAYCLNIIALISDKVSVADQIAEFITQENNVVHTFTVVALRFSGVDIPSCR